MQDEAKAFLPFDIVGHGAPGVSVNNVILQQCDLDIVFFIYI